MAKQARAGELRTRVYVMDRKDLPYRIDRVGNRIYDPVEVQRVGRPLLCKWVNAYGNEVYTARQARVQEPATLTLRYTPYVTPTCILFRRGDGILYEVLSVNDVENRHTWLEVKVQRSAPGR